MPYTQLDYPFLGAPLGAKTTTVTLGAIQSPQCDIMPVSENEIHPKNDADSLIRW